MLASSKSNWLLLKLLSVENFLLMVSVWAFIWFFLLSSSGTSEADWIIFQKTWTNRLLAAKHRGRCANGMQHLLFFFTATLLSTSLFSASFMRQRSPPSRNLSIQWTKADCWQLSANWYWYRPMLPSVSTAFAAWWRLCFRQSRTEFSRPQWWYSVKCCH